MRAAIFTQLKTITAFGNRVYQAYTAPSNTTTPYCTFKFTQDLNAVGNRSGSWRPLEVYIYNGPTSFVSLDTLVKSVIDKLNNVTLTKTGGNIFTCELVGVSSDIFDDQRQLLSKVVEFRIPFAKK